MARKSQIKILVRYPSQKASDVWPKYFCNLAGRGGDGGGKYGDIKFAYTNLDYKQEHYYVTNLSSTLNFCTSQIQTFIQLCLREDKLTVLQTFPIQQLHWFSYPFLSSYI